MPPKTMMSDFLRVFWSVGVLASSPSSKNGLKKLAGKRETICEIMTKNI